MSAPPQTSRPTRPSRATHATRPARLADEWDSFKLLTRTFFGRIFDAEALSSRGGAPALLWLAAFIATPGFTYAFRSLAKYSALWMRPMEQRVLAAWPDKLFFVYWALASTGFLAVLAWEALLPDRRDCLILQALPVRRVTSATARLAALMLFLLVMVGAAGGFSTMLFPTMLKGGGVTDSWVLAVIAHVVSIMAASALVFFGVILLQLILVNVVDARWFRRAATLAQCASVVVLLLLFLVEPRTPLVEWVRGDAGFDYMGWLPPFWFFGLYETILGTSQPVLRGAAVRGLLVVTLVVGATLAMYALSYQRHLRRMIESPEAGQVASGTRAWSGVVNRAIAWCVPRPVERAIFDFVLTTLVRSAKHRVILSGYAGVGVAFVVAGMTSAWLRQETLMASPPTITALGLPLIVSFFLLAGLRVSFGTTTDLAANWSFRATESADRRAYTTGVRKAMLLVGGLLPAAAALPVSWAAWGFPIALAHAIWSVLLARVLIVVLTTRYPRIPFTYVVVPGSSNVKAWWPAYVAAFSIYAYVTPAWERVWLASPWRLAGFFVAVVLVEIAVRTITWEKYTRVREPELIYDDDSDQLVLLNLTGGAR
jgi:hypothetical protein